MSKVKLFRKQSGNYSVCSGTELVGEFESAADMFGKIQELQASTYRSLNFPVQFIRAEYRQSQAKQSLHSVTLKDCEQIFKKYNR